MKSIADQLRHRIIIQHNVVVRDQYNNVSSEGWQDYKTLWAKVSGFSGRDLIAAKAAGSEVTARLKLRKRDDITTDMRVLFKDQVYQISSPAMPDDEDGNTYMTFLLTSQEKPP